MKTTRSPRLIACTCVLTVCAALIASAAAQQAPASATAADLARYDTNRNGRLDPDELAAQQAAGARAANVPVKTGAGTATQDSVVHLSPFEVTAEGRGYQATTTMSGTRLNAKLEDLASAISVVTKEQMADFAMLDLNDVFNYETGTEGTGNYTDVTIDRNGMAVDNIQNNPQGANRIRGMGPANITFNNFSTTGRVPVDTLNIDALEISRGPNSSIFGIGEGAGTVNLVGATANLSRAISTAQMRFDDLGGWRTSLDLSRPVIRNKLALRVSGARQHDAYPQKPSGFDSKRFNAMLRAQPFKYTSVRASFQSYRGEGTRPNSVTPRDAVSYWKGIGSPTWDPVTSTVTLNGVKTVMGATNPNFFGHTTSQSGRPPDLFIDRNGVQLWMINQMPAANATNGPNNQAGVERMMESLPEPVRLNRPLFSTVPGVNDKSLYDWTSINLGAPNRITDSVETSTVELEQFLLKKGGHQFAIQGAWHRENADRNNFNTIGQSPAVGDSYYLKVDVNERLLDGRPNPFFLRPYIGVIEGIFSKNWAVRDTYRGQAAYVADFTVNRGWSKWIGRHQFLGYYEFRDDESYNYTYRHANVSLPGNPIYINPRDTRGDGSGNTSVRTYNHYYVGDNQGQNADYAPGTVVAGQYDFNWFNPQTRQWVADRADLGSVARTGSGSRNVIKTRGAMMQSSLLKNRLVLTLGKREDQNSNKPFNAASRNPDQIDFDYLTSEQLRNVNWTMQEGSTLTKGIVVKPLRWFHVHYNESDSFKPDVPRYNLAFELLSNPRTEGKDYGFSLNLFDGKLVVRANRYDVATINTRAGQSATLASRVIRLDRSTADEDGFNLTLQATNWVRAANPTWTSTQIQDEVFRISGYTKEQEDLLQRTGITETGDIRSKGDEIEIYYNPDDFWTAKLNVTRTNTFDTRIAPGIPARIAARMPLWTSIIDPRTNTPWWTTSYIGTRGPNTPLNFFNTAVLAPVQLAQASEGTRRAQVREWRANFSTSYRLAGLTGQKHLKRMSVGGAIRWEDKGAIGYHGIPIDGDIGAATAYDRARPIYSPANTYIDAFVTYNVRLLSDKVRARLQLNCRNLQESGGLTAVGAYPDGRPHTFRIINPRTFIFTATFDL
ncbi:MAG: TonB-dependent receptor plug domain-containing protein [Opitutaceae bacterium]